MKSANLSQRHALHHTTTYSASLTESSMGLNKTSSLIGSRLNLDMPCMEKKCQYKHKQTNKLGTSRYFLLVCLDYLYAAERILIASCPNWDMM